MYLCNYKRGRTVFCASRNSVFLFRGKYLFLAFAHFLSGSRPRWETRPRSHNVSSVAWQARGRAGARAHARCGVTRVRSSSGAPGRTAVPQSLGVPSAHGSHSSYFAGIAWRTENKAWHPAREQWHLRLLLTNVIRRNPAAGAGNLCLPCRQLLFCS